MTFELNLHKDIKSNLQFYISNKDRELIEKQKLDVCQSGWKGLLCSFDITVRGVNLSNLQNCY